MALNITTTGTITGSVTASTISFATPITISDSGAGFGIFAPGDVIKITGSVSNDGSYQIATASASTITITRRVVSITTEGAGASITIDKGVDSGLVDLFLQPIILVHPETIDARLYASPDELAENDVLGSGIDGGELTFDADGRSVASGAELETFGAGFGGGQTLAETLILGNTAGANGIDMQGNTIQLSDVLGDIQSISTDGNGNIILASDAHAVHVTADAGLRVFNGLVADGSLLSFQNLLAGDIAITLLAGNTIAWTDSSITAELTALPPTANRTYTLKDESGTIAFLTDIPTVPAAQDLASVLLVGNTSGVNDIQMGLTQGIIFNDVLNYIREISAAGKVQYGAAKGHEFISGTATLEFSVNDQSLTFRNTVTPIGFGTDDTQWDIHTNGTLNYTNNDNTFGGTLYIPADTFTAYRTYTFPDKDGTVAMLSDIVAAPVASVNTQTGVVVLDADDISDAATTNKFVTAGDLTNLSNLSGTNSGDQVIANQTTVNTGTNTTEIVTPDTLEDKTMGTYTGTTITDNVVLKVALQELETAVESAASGGLVMKSGTQGGFTGNPKKATVTFSTAFVDANYSPTLTGQGGDSYGSITVESVTAGSFVINLNSNANPTNNILWTAIKHGES